MQLCKNVNFIRVSLSAHAVIELEKQNALCDNNNIINMLVKTE